MNLGMTLKKMRFEKLEDRRVLATYFVTSSVDAPVSNEDGSFSGTLRQMIVNANENLGADTIVSNLSSGTEIELRSLLPITDPVVLSGNNLHLTKSSSFSGLDTAIALFPFNNSGGVEFDPNHTFKVQQLQISDFTVGITVDEQGTPPFNSLRILGQVQPPFRSN